MNQQIAAYLDSQINRSENTAGRLFRLIQEEKETVSEWDTVQASFGLLTGEDGLFSFSGTESGSDSLMKLNILETQLAACAEILRTIHTVLSACGDGGTNPSRQQPDDLHRLSQETDRLREELSAVLSALPLSIPFDSGRKEEAQSALDQLRTELGYLRETLETFRNMIRQMTTVYQAADEGPGERIIPEKPCLPHTAEKAGKLPEPEPERHPVTPDLVQFSAVSPRTIRKGEYAMIDLLMYEPSWRSVVDQLIETSDEPVRETRSGLLKAKLHAAVRVVLTSPDLSLSDNEDTQIWEGGYLRYSFAAEVPPDYAKKQILFTARVYLDDVILTRLQFIARCDAPESRLAIERSDVTSAFISYASQDRQRVATILQGMKTIRPDLNVFFDVENLRSGENWENTLYREIDTRDVLFLCWSHFAKESRWVDLEWRYALRQKGIDAIEPVPIERADQCPPPEELGQKHFNDRLLYIINS